jgi:hypothetical protein
MNNNKQSNGEELDVHSYVPLICKKQTINITAIENETKQTSVDKAADDYFKLSHSRLKNEQQKEYERELFIAGANCMIRIINKTQTEMTNETQQTAVDFVPYEEAFTLKELGFNEPCLGYYLCRNSAFGIDDLEITTERIDLIRYDYASCAAPTFSQAFRWFRDKHNLHHMLNPFNRVEIIERDLVEFISFGYAIQDKVVGRTDFKTHEEAELACLRKLIELCKK